MKVSRSLIVVGAATLLVAAWRAPGVVPPLGAAPAGFPDVPGSLAAADAGDVFIGFWTDYGVSVVGRFSADGEPLARWSVARLAGTDHDVAEADDGGVFVAVNDVDAVRHYTEHGQQTAEWSVDGLVYAISTATRTGGAETEVFVIASVADGGREVRRYGPGGDLRGSFPVADWAADLAVSSADSAGDQYVFVEESTSNSGGLISRYRADGAWLDSWGTRGDIAGMDTDAATDRLWAGYSRFSDGVQHVQEWTFDGEPGTRCELSAYPIDLAIGQDGDLYILTSDDPRPEMGLVRDLRRHRQDCTTVATWDWDHLNRVPPPTRTAQATTTAEPSATTMPTQTPTPTPTPWWIYLPAAQAVLAGSTEREPVRQSRTH